MIERADGTISALTKDGEVKAANARSDCCFCFRNVINEALGCHYIGGTEVVFFFAFQLTAIVLFFFQPCVVQVCNFFGRWGNENAKVWFYSFSLDFISVQPKFFLLSKS